MLDLKKIKVGNFVTFEGDYIDIIVFYKILDVDFVTKHILIYNPGVEMTTWNRFEWIKNVYKLNDKGELELL